MTTAAAAATTTTTTTSIYDKLTWQTSDVIVAPPLLYRSSYDYRFLAHHLSANIGNAVTTHQKY